MLDPRRWCLVLCACCLFLAAQRGSAMVPVFAATAARANPVNLDQAGLAARIAELVIAKYAEKGVPPAKPADDAEFLRRVYLDLNGRIPRVSEVREFLADQAPDKRRRVVD